ncbi:unnamed protein product [Paramecium sonneborni]|uniref:Uncharacterized protein n=1 Tax=Paramecium sonneborni TaxID=65129 RepID=A0A8S1RMS5_9CILI|nr:unnamed protein product [Paramecium sonneborni]
MMQKGLEKIVNAQQIKKTIFDYENEILFLCIFNITFYYFIIKINKEDKKIYNNNKFMINRIQKYQAQRILQHNCLKLWILIKEDMQIIMDFIEAFLICPKFQNARFLENIQFRRIDQDTNQIYNLNKNKLNKFIIIMKEDRKNGLMYFSYCKLFYKVFVKLSDNVKERTNRSLIGYFISKAFYYIQHIPNEEQIIILNLFCIKMLNVQKKTVLAFLVIFLDQRLIPQEQLNQKQKLKIGLEFEISKTFQFNFTNPYQLIINTKPISSFYSNCIILEQQIKFL